jgi:hypothetical protein
MQCICKVNDEIFFITKESFFFCAPKGINERRVEDERKKNKKEYHDWERSKIFGLYFWKKELLIIIIKLEILKILK